MDNLSKLVVFSELNNTNIIQMKDSNSEKSVMSFFFQNRPQYTFLRNDGTFFKNNNKMY